MEDTFPYKRYDPNFDKDRLFKRLQTHEFNLNYKPYYSILKIKSDIPIYYDYQKDGKYAITFITDKNVSKRLGKTRGSKIYARIIYDNQSYELMDKITDYYTEDVRVRAKRSDQDLSPYEWYNQNRNLLMNTNAREEIYKSCKECTQFKASLVVSIIDIFNSKKMLDFSAGWGDRLIGAIASDISYTGIDPNINLKRGHDEIIKDFGNSNLHKVIYQPSQQVDFSLLDRDYDLIYTSPPFFDLESYSNDKTQSMETYPIYEEWLVYFLFNTIKKVWSCLKESGYMILYIGDSKLNYIVEPMMYYILYVLNNVKYLGVISVKSGITVPNYVFKKTKKPSMHNRVLVGEEFQANYPMVYSMIHLV